MTAATGDPINDAILGMLERIAAKDAVAHAAVREEIAAKGTWWAASEIARLRRSQTCRS